MTALHLLHQEAGIIDGPVPLLEPAMRQRIGGRAGIRKDQMVVTPVIHQPHPAPRGGFPGNQRGHAGEQANGQPEYHYRDSRLGKPPAIAAHGALLSLQLLPRDRALNLMLVVSFPRVNLARFAYRDGLVPGTPDRPGTVATAAG
jgi:hypothetical protein